MPKKTTERIIQKPVGFYASQLEDINFFAPEGNVTEFIRELVQEGIDRRKEMLIHQNKIILDKPDDDALVMPAKLFKEIYGVGDQYLKTLKAKKKIKLQRSNGIQYVIVIDSVYSSPIAKLALLDDNMSRVQETVLSVASRVKDIEFSSVSKIDSLHQAIRELKREVKEIEEKKQEEKK